MQRIWWLIGLLFLPVLTCLAEPVYLSALEIEPKPALTRLNFTLSQKTLGKIRYLPAPDRVIIEFKNANKNIKIQNATLHNPLITSFLSQTLPNDNLRFTFTVTEPVTWVLRELTNGDGQVIVQIDLIPQKINKTDSATQKTFKKTLRDHLLKTFSDSLTEMKQRSLNDDRLVGRSRLDFVKKLAEKKSQQLFTVIIDAGHGGKDPGARGKEGTNEKDIVLAIAKNLANEINQQPNMRAVLTRKGDYFIPLRERLRIARKNDGDLFIAVHADAYFNKQATGASVYALSQHGATSEAARWLAQKDNYSELGDVELDALKDRSTMVRSVLIDLAQTKTIQDSVRLGNKILDSLDNITSLHYSHVEQAPFMVLKSPDIPSVLVETGFISNPKEEKRLSTAGYQTQLAAALLQAIRQYKKNVAI